MKTKMKKLNTVLIGLLFALAIVISLIPAEITNADAYRYTVRIFSGNRGTLPGDPYTFTVESGQKTGKNFSPDKIRITDDRYCFVGLRRSGTDMLISLASLEDIEVNEDMDFVCAYAPAAIVVPYTVSYKVAGSDIVLGTAECIGQPNSEVCILARDFEGYTPRFSSVTAAVEENAYITFEYEPFSDVNPVINPEPVKVETIPKPVKKANPLKLTVTKKTFRRSALKNAKSFNIGVKKAQGKVTYTLNKKAKKAKIKVTRKGKVTLPKNCKPGTYKITVKAAGKGVYKAGKKKVTIVVKKK